MKGSSKLYNGVASVIAIGMLAWAVSIAVETRRLRPDDTELDAHLKQAYEVSYNIGRVPAKLTQMRPSLVPRPQAYISQSQGSVPVLMSGAVIQIKRISRMISTESPNGDSKMMVTQSNLAKAAHNLSDANKAYCQAVGLLPPARSVIPTKNP